MVTAGLRRFLRGNISTCMQPFKTRYKPAGDNDDILRDVGHLFDGQVAHPPQGLLREKNRVLTIFMFEHYRPMLSDLSFFFNQISNPLTNDCMEGILHHWTERAWSSQRRPPWPQWSRNALPK